MNVFLAHINDLEPDYKKPLGQFNCLKSLVNNNGKFFLADNVCPHQLSRIISKEQKEFKCQYHGWAWNNDGSPKNNHVSLNIMPVFETNGLLFQHPIDADITSKIDFTKMIKVVERIDNVKADYRHIMDLFLDVDHIPIAHPGVYNKIGIDGSPNINWHYYNWGSIQEVLLEDNSIGAMWIAVYPYTMIEWQPGALFVTICNPKNEVTDVSVNIYHEPGNSLLQILNSEIFETAWSQDCKQAEAMTDYILDNPNLDNSKKHFRNWLKWN